MNLVSRPLEKALIDATHRRINRSPAHRKDLVRRRQPIRWFLARLGRVFKPLLLAVVPCVISLLLLTGKVDLPGGFAIGIFIATLLCFDFLRDEIGSHFRILARLPIRDADVIRAVGRGHAVGALSFWLVMWFFLQWVLPGIEEKSASSFLSVYTSAIGTLVFVSIIIHCLAWLSDSALRRASNLITLIFMSSFLFKSLPEAFVAGIRLMVELLGFVTPPGWVMQWHVSVLNGDDTAGFWLIPIAAVLMATRQSWARLLGRWSASDIAAPVLQLSKEQWNSIQVWSMFSGAFPPPSAVPLDIKKALVEKGWFFLPPSLRGIGWIERLIDRFLTQRERVLVDAMRPMPPRWTLFWKYSTGIALVGLVVAFVLKNIRPDEHLIVLFIGFGACCVFAMPAFNQLSRAQIPCPVAGGSPMPHLACLPISYFEMARLDFKISFIRAACALPPLLLLAAASGWLLLDGEIAFSTILALKVTVLILASRPLAVVLSFSPHTDDTDLGRFAGWCMLGAAIVVMVTGIVLVFMSFLPEAGNATFWIGGYAVLMWGAYRLYGECYCLQYFDLQPQTLLQQQPTG